MYRWERRLKDLAQLLHQCESTYFDPELFRINTNLFLQTSRTVTFLIHKTKADIPDYEQWNKENIKDAWAGDPVMTWAKDSRNTIEKEGDLDMFSSLSVTLFFSYITAEDISVPCGRTELLAANVKKLKRFAQKVLPSSVSDGAVIRTERKWIANTLPNWELLQAFRYVYSRLYECCNSLSTQMGSHLDHQIRRPTESNVLSDNPRETLYFKLNSNDSSVLRHVPMRLDIENLPENPFTAINARSEIPTNLDELVNLYAQYAITLFNKDGYHVPMCFLFDESNRPIDSLTTEFADQADKFIFWRSLADRISYIKPTSVLWISEGWTRNARKAGILPIRNLPITGEFLEVVALDKNGELKRVNRMINRDKQTDVATVGEEPMAFEYPEGIPNFFLPAFEALQLAHHQ